MSASIQKNTFRRLALIAAAALAAQSFAALPEIRITTQNNAEPQAAGGGTCPGAWTVRTTFGTLVETHMYKYVGIREFSLTDAGKPANNISARTGQGDSIRLRGNSTVSSAKKPYRIKFGGNLSLFGKDAAKSWVLLANFYDGTFALNAMAFEMGKRMGLEFTNSSQLVNVYINNQYKGIYQLTEQIQSHKGRVDLKEKKHGWLAELDYHPPASDECKRAFTTGDALYNLTTTIKSPELDDTSFTKNPDDSTSLRFVKTDIYALVNKMKESSFPENGYRDLIDLESFAKYMLIQLVLDNFDFNVKALNGGYLGSNFMYRLSDTSKIKAGPLWDFDLSAGVSTDMTFRHYKNYTDPVTPTHAFYKRLWEDNVLKAKYKKLWIKHKQDFSSMKSLADEIKSLVESSVNNNTWNGGTLNAQTLNTEVSGLKTWLDQRINWVDGQLAGIDTSKDIPDKKPPTTSVAAARFGAVKGGVALVKNGLKINANCGASVKIVTLTGAVLRRRTLDAGSHAVSLGDLPRGMYLVRTDIDGVKKTVRMAIR